MNVLQLRTRLAFLNIKWTNLPPIESFTKYNDIFEYDINNQLENYKIIGYKNCQYQKYNNIENYMHNAIYLLSDLKSHIYISLGFCCPFLWYNVRIEDLEDLDDIQMEKICDIIEGYDLSNYVKYDSSEYILINNDVNINDVQKVFLMSDMVEFLMWGSKHKKYPFDRDVVLFSSNKDKINYITKAMEQDDNKIQIKCRTLWSKSTIIINKNGTKISLTIKYNSFCYGSVVKRINKKQNKQFTTDLPLDVILLLMFFQHLTFNKIITHKDIINNNDDVEQIQKLLDIIVPNNDIQTLLESLDDYSIDDDKNKKIIDMYQKKA